LLPSDEKGTNGVLQSIMTQKENCIGPYGCSVGATLSVIGGRWKPIIIFKLLQNDFLRFGELKKEINMVTQRMLTTQLRELEGDKIVSRKVYAQVPPRVEYSLTDYGRSLEPIMIAMRNWGAEHMNVKNAEPKV
jgi:DNA-binding HxlR family transcriptional regulator